MRKEVHDLQVEREDGDVWHEVILDVLGLIAIFGVNEEA